MERGRLSSSLRTDAVSTRIGTLNVLPNDRPIGEALRLYGEWAQGELEILAQLLPARGTIVDGGGHIGVHARSFALAAPGALVHTFEPHPQLATVLRSNAADLEGRIVVHDCGLGASADPGYVAEFDLETAANAGAQSVAFSPDAANLKVDMTPLDALDLKDVGFIKLDIEGAEVAALAGAARTIARDRPVIACEVNTLDSGVDLLLQMQQLSYSAHLLVARAFNPANFSREVRNIFGFASETTLLFLPPGKQPPPSTEIAALHPAGSVHDLAQAFLSAPRYGDESAYARNAVVLRERLRSANAKIEALANSTRDEAGASGPRTVSVDLRKELAALRADVRAQQDELARARADASVSKEHRRATQHRHDLLQSQHDELSGKFEAASEKLTELAKEIQEQRATAVGLAEQLETEIRRGQEVARALQEQVSQQRAKAEGLADQLAAEIERGKAEIERSKAEVKRGKEAERALQADLAQQRAATAALAEQLEAEVTRGKETARELHEEASQQRAKSISLVQQLDAEVRRGKDSARALQEEARMLAAKASALEGQLSGQRAHNQASQESMEVLRQTIRDIRNENRRLLLDLRRLDATHGETQSKLETEKTRAATLLTYLQPDSTSKTRRGFVGRLSRAIGGSLVSAREEVRRSGLFDEAWYVRSYPEVGAGRFDPIAHYLLVGGFEGLNPGPGFDTAGYLAAYPDVRTSGLNPLIHYLRWGRRELRRPRGAPSAPVKTPEGRSTEGLFKQKAPPIESFARSTGAAKPHGKPLVDVVVPVYRGYDETIACLASLLTAQNQTPHEITVIDDCSPEPELSEALRELAALKLIKLVRNAENLGFVRTANRGMSLSADRDVVLLNSDTLVFNDWLDRLRAHASASRVASVTPLTNSGTICSYPKFCADNAFPADTRLDRIDELARDLAMGSLDVPTGVGFCMYVTRAALNDVGLFDELTFGKGYGEENDLCMRAAARGWKNVQALDTFVFHSGETSFGDSAKESKARGLAAIQQKHPTYQAAVDAHIASDPARGARIALDVARILGRKPNETVVCISHNLGGGIHRHLTDRMLAAAAQGQDVLIVTPSAPGGTRLRMVTDGDQRIANAADLDLTSQMAPFAAALKALNVRTIELHSTVGWSHRIVDLIPALVAGAGAQLKIVMHDYTFACPQTTLINESGRYCGELGEEQCASCLSKMTLQPRIIHPDLTTGRLPTIQQWRRAYGTLLAKANVVTAPSADTAERLNRYFAQPRIDVEPHVEDLTSIAPITPSPGPHPLRIAVVGAIGPHKGSAVLLGCARDAKARRLPLEFTVVGYTNIDEDLRKAGVTITGKYEEGQIGRILQDASPDVVMLPSVWPETFCYTLSIALATRLPIVAFDLGAQHERLQSYERALLLPIAMSTLTNEINDKILAFANLSGELQDA